MSNLLTTVDESAWRQALPIGRSVFGSVEYARILEKQHGYAARLFTGESNGARYAYPFLLRPIAALRFPGVAHARFDTLTPEYTGPISVSGAELDGSAFRSAWEDNCRKLGIVAEFAHLHPWDAQPTCLDGGSLTPDRDIVFVDLTVPLDTLRNEHFRRTCRQNLRRAEAEEVEVFRATKLEDLDEFCRLYLHTMERNNALSKYYFSREYFATFFETLPDNACFMLARHGGEIISGALYLHDDSNVYYHLAGTNRAYQKLMPSNAVLFEAIRWAKAQGKKRLILGGGYKRDDGIFRFKAGFSPLRAQFSVYRKIHAAPEYRALTASWAKATGGDPSSTRYFPAYRSPEPAQLERQLS